MIAVDTSVVVPAFASWHEGHRQARELLGREAAIPAHVTLETYSVLTRMPAPHRAPSDVVGQFLARRFPGQAIIVPSTELSRTVVARCEQAGVDGGAVYDALVGLTAAEAGHHLITRDGRAAVTYRKLGVDFTLVG